ncbi:hypothetical protein [Cohnella thermotolerans]|uniref:hypothetical protein n=1 Tax=Cohnella thermotolerans TaxID=329858 RepID=UPI00047B387E|nr:hypothetical protein [Cohnella thermotolerans]
MNEYHVKALEFIKEFKEASLSIIALPLEGEGSTEVDQTLHRLQEVKLKLSEAIDRTLSVHDLNPLPQEFHDLCSECRELENLIQSKLQRVAGELRSQLQKFAVSRRIHSSYSGEISSPSGFFIDNQR